jgi:hypothetical protein
MGASVDIDPAQPVSSQLNVSALASLHPRLNVDILLLATWYLTCLSRSIRDWVDFS